MPPQPLFPKVVRTGLLPSHPIFAASSIQREPVHSTDARESSKCMGSKMECRTTRSPTQRERLRGRRICGPRIRGQVGVVRKSQSPTVRTRYRGTSRTVLLHARPSHQQAPEGQGSSGGGEEDGFVQTIPISGRIRIGQRLHAPTQEDQGTRRARQRHARDTRLTLQGRMVRRALQPSPRYASIRHR